jgi:UDP-3-O-[3-hydroxymyristoyl] N-acetylglucosamine deacetylase
MTKGFQLNYLQSTIIEPFSLSGVGVHTGRAITARIEPSDTNSGICFWRKDIHEQNNKIQAHINNTVSALLCTRIENNDGVGINTIEHFMSALFAMGIDNANIYVDGPEMPILDGSSELIVKALLKAGQRQQKYPASYLKIIKEVSIINENGAWASIIPSSNLELSLHIDFPDPGIGQQKIDYSFTTSSYIETIAPARTFCMLRDVENMQHAGLAKGGTLENAVVVDNGKILNEGGLRMIDECVRHKALDCMGDLFLTGMPIFGKIEAFKPGHALTLKLLHTLMADKSAYVVKTISEDVAPARGFVNLPKSAAAIPA